ncbi:MAG: ribosome-associated translation inhibitor RaiA [Thermodesulfobacteriota bacterium]
MDIMVTFRRMEPVESLRDYAQEKLSKLRKYLDTPFEAHVVLEVEKFRHIADVTVNIDGATIKGVEETEDMYSAIDQVLDKIEIQVKRHRSKIRERRPEAPRTEATEEPAAQAGEEPSIVVEKLVTKPMDPEEAAMQLNMSQQDFLVFRNARSKEMNVLYKRRDGHLGLIEPSN